MRQSNPLPPHLRCTIKKKSKITNTQDLLKIAAPKSVQFLYNIVSIGPRVILRSAFQLLRANTITRILSCVVLLSIDTVSLIRKKISMKQYIINVSLALMLLIGGTAGWVIGGHVVSITLIENAAIGILAALAGAGLLGGALAFLWEKFISLFLKGDTEEMLDIFNHEFYNEVTANCLEEDEIVIVRDSIELTPQVASEMFACKDKRDFAKAIICPAIEKLKEGELIHPPEHHSS